MHGWAYVSGKIVQYQPRDTLEVSVHREDQEIHHKGTKSQRKVEFFPFVSL
jgi:hypothetical protein